MLDPTTDRLCRGGAAVENLADSASFHAWEKTAPSNPGIKHLGRALSTWRGCHRRESGEVFLLSPAEPDSPDGRYFRTLLRTNIVARLRPVWIAGRGP